MPTSPIPYEVENEVSLSSIIRSLLHWLRRNSVWLLLGMVAGAALGYVMYMTTPKEYTGRFIGYGNNMQDVRLRELVLDLNALRNANEKERLAKLLNLPVEVAGKIRGINGFLHGQLEADVVQLAPREVTVYFVGIEITTLDPNSLPAIQKGIVNYIDNLPEIKHRLELRRSRMEAYAASIKQEIAYLDELKKERHEVKSSTFSLADPAAVSVHKIALSEKLKEAELEIEFLNHELVVTKDVTIVNKPTSPGKYRYTLLWAAYGLLAVLGVFVLKAGWKLSNS